MSRVMKLPHCEAEVGLQYLVLTGECPISVDRVHQCDVSAVPLICAAELLNCAPLSLMILCCVLID